MYITNRERQYSNLAKIASIFFCLVFVCLMVIGMKELTSAEETTESETQQEVIAQKTNEEASVTANEPQPTPTPPPTLHEPEAAESAVVPVLGEAIGPEQLSAHIEISEHELIGIAESEPHQDETGAVEAEEGASESPSGQEDAQGESGEPEAIENDEGDQPIGDNSEGEEEPDIPNDAEISSDIQEAADDETESNDPAEEAEAPYEELEGNELIVSEGEPDNGEEGDDATLDWEYPSGWIESGQKYVRGNIALAGIVKELETQLANEITHIKGVFDIPNSARIKHANDNLCDIIAVYAVLSGQTSDYPYGVKIQSAGDQHKFASIYWDMVKLGYRESADQDNPAYMIEIIRLSAETIAEQYELSENQRDTLAKLIRTSEREKINTIRNEGILSTLSTEDYKHIQERIPIESSGFRRAVLTAALSIEGKVKYFWGGKSYHVGWDERWGLMRTIAAEGSKTTGSARPMGLDCSGFVNWAFINAYGNKDVRSLIGISSREQWARSYSIKWSDAKPGDLVFYHVPGDVNINHVGIVLSAKKSGDYRIIHCSSSNNGVVVTGKRGFKYVRRPYIYGE